MPCYFPLQATFSLRADGKKDIKFSNANARLFQLGVKPLGDSGLSLPCGRCMGCRLEKSRQWAVRCVHESKCFDDNCFVTLTFAPEHLPPDGSLCRKHVQDFLKRLRRKFEDRKIRVFYCGEYGDKLGRPHYHLCLFNFDFKDRVRMYKVNNFWYYRSSILESLWTFGNSICCDFSFETAAYVARYCTKKINGSQADSHYGGRTPEFAGMSLKPGIGKTWFDKYAKSDLFPHDNVVSRGARSKPPRYYDVLREREDPVGFAEAKEARRLQGEENADHATCKRLAVRLKCLESRTRLLVRRLENGV
nr:MAG: replication initiator protein [Microvirus sp.]